MSVHSLNLQNQMTALCLFTVSIFKTRWQHCLCLQIIFKSHAFVQVKNQTVIVSNFKEILVHSYHTKGYQSGT